MLPIPPSKTSYHLPSYFLLNQYPGSKRVKITDMMTMGMLSRAIKMPSFAASGPLKPSLSSATRQQDRMKRHAAANAAPNFTSINSHQNLLKCLNVPLMYNRMCPPPDDRRTLRYRIPRTMQKMAVKRTWLPSPAIMRSTPIGFHAKIAAKDPPQPMKHRHKKSPRMKSVANHFGDMYAKRAPWCFCSRLMPKYRDDDKNVGPSVKPMRYLRWQSQ